MNFLHKVVALTEHTPPAVKHAIDATAVGTAVMSFFDYLPGFASLLSIIWLGLQIYGWFDNRRKNK